MNANDSRRKESSATTETYYLATGRYGCERTLHADPDCTAFGADSTVRERTFVDPDPDELCDRCVDREEGWNQGEKNFDYQRALREAAEEPITDGGQIQACPECDDSDIRRRMVGNLHSRTDPDAPRWKCYVCGHEFDEPRVRPREAQGPRNGLAGELVDAEPDVLPDGGTEIVWTASTAAGESIDTYHTDTDCPSLGNANSIIEREREQLPERASHCLACQDRLGEASAGPDWSYQEALQEHSGDDLVTDGGEETVYVVDPVEGEPATYHRYRSCCHVAEAIHGSDEFPIEAVEDLELCATCETRSERNRSQRGPCHGLAAELDEADPDDVGSDDSPLLTDGGPSYCGACHRAVAREDRLEVGGEVYHRSCAPDEAIENQQFDEFVSDGGSRLRSKADANTGELSRAGVVGWPKPEKEYVDLGERLDEDDDLPDPDRTEQARRARQAAHSLIAWSRRAGRDPDILLASVRKGLPRTDGGESEADHFCEICSTEFETIAALITHDCEDRDAPLVTDGGTDLHRMTNVDATEHYRQKARRLAREKALYVGILLGGIATFIALFVWEVLQA